ncbi:unnamed protein product, partial [Prorocentrum cordatum]
DRVQEGTELRSAHCSAPASPRAVQRGRGARRAARAVLREAEKAPGAGPPRCRFCGLALSSAGSHRELCANLRRHGVLKSQLAFDAYEQVDRADFVPAGIADPYLDAAVVLGATGAQISAAGQRTGREMAASAHACDGNVSLVLPYSDQWLQQCWDFAQQHGLSWKRHRLQAIDAAGAPVSPERQAFLDASDFPLSVQFVPRVPEVAIHIDWSADGIPSRALGEGKDEEPSPLLVDWSREGLPPAGQQKVVFLGPKGALRRRREPRAPLRPSAPTWALPKQQEALAVAEMLRRAPVRSPACPKAPAVLPRRPLGAVMNSARASGLPPPAASAAPIRPACRRAAEPGPASAPPAFAIQRAALRAPRPAPGGPQPAAARRLRLHPLAAELRRPRRLVSLLARLRCGAPTAAPRVAVLVAQAPHCAQRPLAAWAEQRRWPGAAGLADPLAGVAAEASHALCAAAAVLLPRRPGPGWPGGGGRLAADPAQAAGRFEEGPVVACVGEVELLQPGAFFGLPCAKVVPAPPRALVAARQRVVVRVLGLRGGELGGRLLRGRWGSVRLRHRRQHRLLARCALAPFSRLFRQLPAAAALRLSLPRGALFRQQLLGGRGRSPSAPGRGGCLAEGFRLACDELSCALLLRAAASALAAALDGRQQTPQSTTSTMASKRDGQDKGSREDRLRELMVEFREAAAEGVRVDVIDPESRLICQAVFRMEGGGDSDMKSISLQPAFYPESRWDVHDIGSVTKEGGDGFKRHVPELADLSSCCIGLELDSEIRVRCLHFSEGTGSCATTSTPA